MYIVRWVDLFPWLGCFSFWLDDHHPRTDGSTIRAAAQNDRHAGFEANALVDALPVVIASSASAGAAAARN
jgi:hypothetical protein